MFQVISEFGTISSGAGDETFPEPAATFVQALGVCSLDVLGFVPLGCVFREANFSQRVLVKVCGPPVLIALLWCRDVLQSRNTAMTTATKRLVMLLLEVALPNIATSLVQMLVCDSFDDGAFLRADLTVPCNGSNRRREWVMFTAVSLAVYSFGGTPILFIIHHTNLIHQ